MRCPQCGRKVQVRTLRYSHVCGRTFNPLERALEQKKAAEAAVRARQTQGMHKKQPQYHMVEQKIAAVRPATQAPERRVEQSVDNRKQEYKKFVIC